jgi:transcriptional regulator with XRE-family HTH domain
MGMARPLSLADKLEKLFQTVQPLGREYTLEEVALGCQDASGATFSKTYVWSLRRGRQDNPTKRHLEALAAFFGVPVAYFFDEEAAERVETQLALATALRNADIRDVALRMTQLSNLDRRALVRIIDEIGNIKRAAVRPAGDNDVTDAD